MAVHGSIVAWIVWGGLALLAWTYVGYPVVMWWLAKRRPALAPSVAGALPSLSVVLAVRNGAASIASKIENLGALDYPFELLEVIIVDDGSTDETVRIIGDLPSHHGPLGPVSPRLRMLSLPTARGKSAALNAGVAAARGELIMFCDVRQQIAPQAARLLASRFADPTIGAVSGSLVMATAKGPGMYWRYERMIREAESRFDSTVGVTGALYMIRRALYQPIPEETLLDDVYIPLQISLKGYRVILEPAAKVFDQEAETTREFQRKARTLAGNFQLLELLPELLSPRKNGLFLQFVSHKIMRLLCPYALLLVWIGSGLLALSDAPGHHWYAWGWGLQSVCYSAAWLASRIAMPGPLGSFLRLCQTFVVLNAAAVLGLVRYLRRDFSWTR